MIDVFEVAPPRPKEPEYRIESDDFVAWREEFCSAMELLGIASSWRLEFERPDEELSENGTRASVAVSLQQRAALVRISAKQDRKPTREVLADLALHEAIHILIAPLSERAAWRFAQPDDIESATHEVLNGVMSLAQRAKRNAESPR